MIKATITERRVEIRGHALEPDGTPDYSVCAAASCLAQTVREALRRVEFVRLSGEEEAEGLVAFELPDAISHETRAILRTLVLGLEWLAETYPDKVEVQSGL